VHLKNSKSRLGVVCGEDKVRLLAVRRGRPTVSAVLDFSWRELLKDRGRREFDQAVARLRERTDLGRDAFISVPASQAALHVITTPERKGGFMPAQSPDWERITPLDPEQVYYDWRRLEGSAGEGLGRGQAALIRRDLADGLIELVARAGFRVRGLDVEASYAALAGVNLAGDDEDALFVLALDSEVLWSRRRGGRLDLAGALRPLGDEAPAQLAVRACQHAIQVCELQDGARLVLAGPHAREAARALEPEAGEAAGLRPRVREAGLEPPAGLDWPSWAMDGFLRGGRAGDNTLFNLLPPGKGIAWLSGRRTTRLLAWTAGGLLALLLLQVGLGAWWAHRRASNRLEAARTELVQLKRQGRKLRGELKRFALTEQAARSQEQAAGLLAEIERMLPATAWLERLEYNAAACTLYLGGVSKNRAAALFPSRGRLRVQGPLKLVTAPGSGRPALKVVLALKEEGATRAKAKAGTRARPRSFGGARRSQGLNAVPPAGKNSSKRRTLYTPGLPAGRFR
jgi:hypothetical protein